MMLRAGVGFLLLFSMPYAAPLSWAAEKVVPVHIPEGQMDRSAAEPEGRSAPELVARGDAALKAGRLFEADSLYHRALRMSDQAYEAYEGLARVAEARGDRLEAARVLRQALPVEPANRAGLIQLEINAQFAALNRWVEAEGAARQALAAFEQAEAPQALFFEGHYALGLALYKQRRFRDAEAEFHEAEKLLGQAGESSRRSKTAIVHLLLAECYAALGFPRHAVSEVHPALEAAPAAGEDTVKTARRVDESLDQAVRRLKITIMHEYDTNVLTPYNTIVDLNGARAPGGDSMVARFDLSLQSSPDRRWSYGFGLPTSIDTHFAEALGNLDTWDLAPTAWVSWWNLRSFELKLFYTYDAAFLDRNSLKLDMQTQGPELTARWFFDKRYELDAGYSFRTVFFPEDPPSAPVDTFQQQSGQEQRAYLRLAFAGPNPFIQPFVKYTFDDNMAEGKFMAALINGVEAGALFWLGPETGSSRLLLSGGYFHVDFPDNPLRRLDRVGRVRAALELALTKRITAEVEADYTTSHSLLSDPFSYDRVIVDSGFSYALPF